MSDESKRTQAISVRNIRRVAAFKRHELESFNTALSRALDAAEAAKR